MISDHFLSLPLQFRNRTLTWHFEVLGIPVGSPRKETGKEIVTGFEKLTTWEQLVRSTGP